MYCERYPATVSILHIFPVRSQRPVDSGQLLQYEHASRVIVIPETLQAEERLYHAQFFRAESCSLYPFLLERVMINIEPFKEGALREINNCLRCKFPW